MSANRDEAGNQWKRRHKSNERDANAVRVGRREEAIRGLMDCFYDRVERDELLSPYLPGGVSEEHRRTSVSGGRRYWAAPPATRRTWAATRRCSSPSRPCDCARGAASLRLAAQLRGRRRRPSGRPRVPLGARRLRRVGIAPCDAQLPAGRPGLRARTCPSLGLGRGAPLSAQGRPSRSCLAPPPSPPPLSNRRLNLVPAGCSDCGAARCSGRSASSASGGARTSRRRRRRAHARWVRPPACS